MLNVQQIKFLLNSAKYMDQKCVLQFANGRCIYFDSVNEMLKNDWLTELNVYMVSVSPSLFDDKFCIQIFAEPEL